MWGSGPSETTTTRSCSQSRWCCAWQRGRDPHHCCLLHMADRKKYLLKCKGPRNWVHAVSCTRGKGDHKGIAMVSVCMAKVPTAVLQHAIGTACALDQQRSVSAYNAMLNRCTYT